MTITFDFSKSSLPESALKGKTPPKISAGFSDLPGQDLEPILKQAAKVRDRFDSLVVLGIGGSSQGLKAAVQTLFPVQTKPKLFVLESPDPRSVNAVLEQIDLSKTCVNVVSKSGNTVETLALFHFFQKQLKREQIVVTTEKNTGTLYQYVRKENAAFLKIPQNVGGRFSVLSPVGLFPLACVGADIAQMLQGARKAGGEGAYRTALVHHALLQQGKTISVLMPYADALKEFGDWYVQLWAESLGKAGNGQTPLALIGPQAQHSVAQLILDGPKDKVVTFIRLKPDPKNALDVLRDDEWRATAEAFAGREVPGVTLTLPKLDAATLGELFMHFQLQTACMGRLMDMDPFDQPAVEWIKKRLKPSGSA